jgi:hypothetical protein
LSCCNFKNEQYVRNIEKAETNREKNIDKLEIFFLIKQEKINEKIKYEISTNLLDRNERNRSVTKRGRNRNITKRGRNLTAKKKLKKTKKKKPRKKKKKASI